MALEIDIVVPGGTVHYEEDIGGVSNINVHFYFANVVHIRIHFTDGRHEDYYQVPCILYTPPPP